MNCGCESGKSYEYDWNCVGCMARHYVNVIWGPDTKYNLGMRKARYRQLEKAWPAAKFAEWVAKVKELRGNRGVSAG